MKTSRPHRLASAPAQRGVVVVEFALTVLIFLLFVFGLLEFARVLYLWNTAQEITRRSARAAAITDFSNAAAMDALRQNAVFRSSSGALVLGGSISDSYVRIEYLSLSSSGSMTPVSPLPAGPGTNRVNCAQDPHGASCISMVRASLCLPGSGDCGAVPYEPLLPLLAPILGAGGQVPLTVPPSTTVVPAESLGYRPGTWP